MDLLKEEPGTKNGTVTGLRKQITALKEAEGTKYRYLRCGDYDGTSKLYLYNESLNKGYLLILVI